MIIDEWIKRENEELKNQIAELRQDLRETQHRIDSIWWKVAVVTALVTVAVGKVFGKSILECVSWAVGGLL
jgi:cell division septum initiation protein DivIVA